MPHICLLTSCTNTGDRVMRVIVRNTRWALYKSHDDEEVVAVGRCALVTEQHGDDVVRGFIGFVSSLPELLRRVLSMGMMGLSKVNYLNC